MKNEKRSNRMWNLAAIGAVALFSSGCIIHTHGARNGVYDTQSRTRTTTHSSYAYVGGHVIPDTMGGGWCFVTGQHTHGYAPDYPSYYGDTGGHYSYRGPVSLYYYGYHPIPAGSGHGWCNTHGRHVHRYHPGRRAGWQYHRGRRYYWYDDRAPRRDPHPAEPAWADRNPRGEPVRGTARGPAGRPASASASSAPRAQPAAARPAPARPAPARPATSRDNSAYRAQPAAPVRRYGGWEPTKGSVDLGAAESERGGTVAPARPSYGATPAAPAATAATPRTTYGATTVTPAATATPARSTYGATPVAPTATPTSPRATFGAKPVPPSATNRSPRPTFGATPVNTGRTPASRPSNQVDPRWRKPTDPSGGTVTNTSSRSANIRRLGPAKAERAKQGDKDDREAQGLKKKKDSSKSGTKIRLSPATPAKRK